MNTLKTFFVLLFVPVFLFASTIDLESLQIYLLLAVITLLLVLIAKIIYSNRYKQQIESNYQLLFENLPEGLLFIDEQGTIQKVNNTFSKMTGYGKNRLIQNNLYAISPKTQPETGFFSNLTLEMFIKKAKDGHNQRFEWHLTHADGHTSPIEVLLTKTDNNPGWFLLITRDISEVKKIQHEKEFQNATFIQQSKLAELGNMIGAIAHQWKQPLNVIGIIAQDLPDAYAFNELDEKRTTEISNNILEQVQFMSQTIDDFRDFYKPSKEAVVFDVIKAISGIVGLLKTQLNKHNISISLINNESTIIKATGCENEFKQVILSLITNVKDIVDEKSLEECKIEISIKLENEKIIIFIHDNAGGIPEELLPDKVFEPFVSTKADKGTGIGLALGKTIIEDKMHGKIYVENINSGARFTIELIASK